MQGKCSFTISLIVLVMVAIANCCSAIAKSVDEVVIERLRTAILKDEYRTGFEKTTMKLILERECVDKSSYCEIQDIRKQLPWKLRDLDQNASIKVLYFGICDVFPEQYGIPLGDLVTSEKIASIRIGYAFSGLDTRVKLSERDIANLAPDYNLNDPEANLKNLNNLLHQEYLEGKLDTPHFVLDNSQCGQGEIEVSFNIENGLKTVEIIPDFYFEVCISHFGSAFDNDDCRWWEPIGDNNFDDYVTSVWISGTYVWKAKTSSGQLVTGRINVTDFADKTVFLKQ